MSAPEKSESINIGRPAQTASFWQVAVLCLALAVITFAVFGQTLHHAFVNYDDNGYVYENQMVQKGLTLQGIVWAFTYGKIGHWHPLTWLTHMADCQFYGLWAGGHHLTNVALHAMAVVLLFLALREMTGSLWRSAFVAAVFAVHPLRAESVAWIAERKDVLSGVFFMLTLWAYGRYARQPSRGRSAAVALAFALGLLCKNMLVTLPFVLLLLDWWPLQRVQGGATFLGLIREKIPLFLLSVGSCVATALVPEKVPVSDRVQLLERIGNAVVSYVIYLRQMVYPAGLAIPYLYAPNGLPLWQIALALVLLAAISISVWVFRNKRPYLMVGWFWYLGMLVPAMGIIQISYYARADRYTYLPGIGLVLAGTWAVGDWSLGWKHRQTVLGSLMAVVVGVLMVCAWRQTSYWKDGETLWSHTLDCIPGNSVAHDNLGLFLYHQGRLDEAIAQYQAVLQIKRDDTDARNNLGVALQQKGKVDEAIVHYQTALQINPNFAEAHFNLGNALQQQGKTEEAIAHYQTALQIKPDNADAHRNLAIALQQKGKTDDAIAHFQKALEIKPGDADAHYNLANALQKEGRVDEALVHYQNALQIRPGFAEAHYDFARALLRKGNMDDAIAQYQEALQIKPDYAQAHNNLGGALLQTGRVDEAIAHLQRALQINPGYAQAQNNLGNALQQKGRTDQAIAHFQKALEIDPANPAFQNNLAWILATFPEAALRNGSKAVELARQANAHTGGQDPMTLRTLAAALAEDGQFSEAVETAQRALQLAEAQSKPKLVGVLQTEMKLYQAGKPFHIAEQKH